MCLAVPGKLLSAEEIGDRPLMTDRESSQSGRTMMTASCHRTSVARPARIPSHR